MGSSPTTGTKQIPTLHGWVFVWYFDQRDSKLPADRAVRESVRGQPGLRQARERSAEHKIERPTPAANESHHRRVGAGCVLFATGYGASLHIPSLTHSAAPPYRKRSRSVRLLACKRARRGSLSLPTFCEIPRVSNIDCGSAQNLYPARAAFCSRRGSELLPHIKTGLPRQSRSVFYARFFSPVPSVKRQTGHGIFPGYRNHGN